MADAPARDKDGTAESETDAPPSADPGRERPDLGLSDRVRRAVSAGFEAASRSKEDIVRVATGEIRGWLDRVDLASELRKVLAKTVVEVKTEIRFRQADDGAIVSETSNDVKIKPLPKP